MVDINNNNLKLPGLNLKTNGNQQVKVFWCLGGVYANLGNLCVSILVIGGLVCYFGKVRIILVIV